MSVHERSNAPDAALLERYLSLAPVAFAVTEGPGHELAYANRIFHQLLDSGDIILGGRSRRTRDAGRTTDLLPLLDRALRGKEIIRDELITPAEGPARWSCTIWPAGNDALASQGLCLEVRDAALVEAAIARQRVIAERLLLGALREKDAARIAADVSDRATFLASVSRDLARSIDEDLTLELIRRSALPRAGTWCIVEIIEPDGGVRRLPIVHPDSGKQALADRLLDVLPREAKIGEEIERRARGSNGKPTMLAENSADALVDALHGPESLAVLRRLGFSSLLVVPLLVRDRVLGTMIFVSPEGAEPFSPEEVALASDLADRCAMALDNARLYREAHMLRVAADQANRAKSQILGSVSHELRTPLNAIGGYVELLQLAAHGPLTEEQKSDLGRIKENQAYLTTLISQILSFVRGESGRVEYRYADVPVQGAIEDVAKLLDAAARERQLTVEIQPGAPGVTVWADADRVRQILMNIVMNAVKYTPPGGGGVTLSASATDETASMHVADTGPGIPEDKLELIFEPFVQLESGLGSRQGGVGLGLPISRDLARSMHGDVTVESTLGKGSTFTLTLPRHPRGDETPARDQGQEDKPAAEREEQPAPGKGGKTPRAGGR